MKKLTYIVWSLVGAVAVSLGMAVFLEITYKAPEKPVVPIETIPVPAQ